jgi:hypothetical protein
MATVAGAGAQAQMLDGLYREVMWTDPADELGWQVPPAAHIPVALAGVQDADWSLEDDERKF